MRSLAVFIVSIFVATAAFAADSATDSVARKNKDNGGTTSSSIITDAPLKDDHVMGDRNAPVTIVEYASLSCPHCAHFSNDILPQLQKQYIDAGKVRYILRQFPLNESALKGAMLLDCVGEQSDEKYYTFSKVLFDAQNKWAFDGNYMSALETFATVGGLTPEQFQACVNNTDRETKVLTVKKLANDELKIPYTPFIFINNDIYSGEHNFESVARFIDEKLALAKK